jgi:16S rRNA (guanine966-N2)-methyltransferase
MKHQDRSLRIIGGNWRGRKVSFSNHEQLRPTTDRNRETLFNWLMHDIAGSRALDLYAGSGILGIEALSRGAGSVTLIEKDPEVAAHISSELMTLSPEKLNWSVIRAPALEWLADCDDTFDIIFLDPPFAGNELQQAADLINERNLCAGFVYLETNKALEEEQLPGGWRIHRHKRAGDVHFHLCDIG